MFRIWDLASAAHSDVSKEVVGGRRRVGLSGGARDRCRRGFGAALSGHVTLDGSIRRSSSMRKVLSCRIPKKLLRTIGPSTLRPCSFVFFSDKHRSFLLRFSSASCISTLLNESGEAPTMER